MEQPEAAGLQLASTQDRGGAGVAAFRAIKRRKMHKPIRKCNRLLFVGHLEDRARQTPALKSMRLCLNSQVLKLIVDFKRCMASPQVVHCHRSSVEGLIFSSTAAATAAAAAVCRRKTI